MEIIVKNFDELTGHELYSILRNRVEVFVMEQDVPYQELDEADFVSVHVMLKENNTLIGYLRVVEPGVKYSCASIGRVLIAKKYRGKGFARMLMIEGIKIAKTMSAEVEIEAQTYLRNFYLSLGFTQISDEYILEFRPHIRMLLR